MKKNSNEVAIASDEDNNVHNISGRSRGEIFAMAWKKGAKWDQDSFKG